MKQQQPQQTNPEPPTPTARAPAASQQDGTVPPPSPKPAAPSSNSPDAEQQPMLPSRIKALRSFQLDQAGNSPNRGSIASPGAENDEAGSPLTRRRLRRGGGAETASSPSAAP